jgi:hypothetical protein
VTASPSQHRAHVFFAFDLALAVDLPRAASLVSAQGAPTRKAPDPRAPSSLATKPARIRFLRDAAPITLAGFSTLPQVECTLYDFGAISLCFCIPISPDIESLIPLGESLYEHPGLTAAALAQARALLTELAPALTQPALDEAVEDYVVYELASPLDPNAFFAAHAQAIARLLRAEGGPLAPQATEEALASRLQYGPTDAAIVDWNAALLLNHDADDARLVLEFVNVELLELRFLDAKLDRLLDASYRALASDTLLRRLWPGAGQGQLHRIARLQVDAAVLFEGVNNALKLVGDQYLAKLYHLAGRRMSLPEWDAVIMRKLATAESTYEKLQARQDSSRMEFLEAVVILLIAFEIIYALLGK